MVAAHLRKLVAAWLHRWRWRITSFVAGGVAAGALAGLFALAVVEFGLYDTASTKPHYRLVSWAAHATFIHSTQMRAQEIRSPSHFTPQQVSSGFQQYEADCMMCHGGPGVSRARWVRGLTPTPPYLLNAAYHWTPAQLDYILEHGVKMSAMPSWGETRTHAQIWSIVAFLEALPNISPEAFKRMQATWAPDKAPAQTRSAGDFKTPDPEATVTNVG